MCARKPRRSSVPPRDRPGSAHGQRSGASSGSAKSRPRGGTAPTHPASAARSSVLGVEDLLERQAWEMLTPLLSAADTDPAAALRTLRSYARLLVHWNRSVSNLISKNDESRLVARHLRESLEPAGWLKESGYLSWMDFGSGAGFPAIPLAIVGVGHQWLLVESRRPKTLFLRKLILELGLKNVSVAHSRLETMDPGVNGFDGFSARATESLPSVLELARDRVRPGGSAFLWKGSRWREEMAEAGRSWRRRWRFEGAISLGSGPIVVARFTRANGD